ncbi:hypothetical protein ACGFXC_09095 [Streptomyces sp. NPDC048507]|uniref:hypothetical protein n=1 Tax=Streptomyces sp. NPDC048507 TaxID=3365560 RepID=UPI003713499F
MFTLLLVLAGLAVMVLASLALGLLLGRAVRHGEQQDRATRHSSPHAAYWGAGHADARPRPPRPPRGRTRPPRPALGPHRPKRRTPMTPAEELFAAAEQLRDAAQRAERESPSPWRLDGDVVRCADGRIVADASCEPDRAGDLSYIAAMQPRVGAALADLLERAALSLTRDPLVDTTVMSVVPIQEQAIAQALLGQPDGSS